MYGIAENVGLHVVVSNVFWWASLGIAYAAYRNRSIWNVGETPWGFLFLMFLSFGIRELGHFSGDPLLGAARYVFGGWSAIFMVSFFMYLFRTIHLRKKPSNVLAKMPFAVMLAFPLLMAYMFYAGSSAGEVKNGMGSVEGVTWIIGGGLIVYLCYLLGSRSTGGFVRFYMFFQFAAYLAVTWKVFGLLRIESYAIREIFETLFGLFAAAAVYTLERMLKKLSGKGSRPPG